MKTILTLIAAALFLLPPVSSFAAYIIHLLDGTKFVTDQYVEEGDQIKFKRYGGLFGIEKDRVREIEETEDMQEAKQVPTESPGPTGRGENEQKEKSEEATPKPQRPEQESGKQTEKVNEKDKETDKQGVSKEERERADEIQIAKIQTILDKKRQILAEKNGLFSAYREAKARNDTLKQQSLRKSLLQSQRELSDLRDNVKADHGGKLPPWWDELE